MSRRNKLVKFTELLTFPNVFECFDFQKPELSRLGEPPEDMKTKWGEIYFKNNKPITIELACGHGDYTIALAKRYPERNFIGVDIKGARIWKGALRAQKDNLSNVAFIRTKIEVIHVFFGKDEIDQIWITFPDPFLKESKFNRRLTSPNFLKKYKEILKHTGSINLKTDSPEFYNHTKDILKEVGVPLTLDKDDIYSIPDLIHPDLDIKTYYEMKHLALNKKIKFVQFNLSALSSD